MYTKIINPKTGLKVTLNSRLGKRILRNYLFVLNGGSAASKTPSDEGVSRSPEEEQAISTARLRRFTSTNPGGSKAATKELMVRGLLMSMKGKETASLDKPLEQTVAVSRGAAASVPMANITGFASVPELTREEIIQAQTADRDAAARAEGYIDAQHQAGFADPQEEQLEKTRRTGYETAPFKGAKEARRALMIKGLLIAMKGKETSSTPLEQTIVSTSGAMAPMARVMRFLEIEEGTPPYTLIQTIEAHTEPITGLIALPDGKLVSCTEEECKIWRVKDGKFIEIQRENCGQGILLTDGRLVCAEKEETCDFTSSRESTRPDQYCTPTFTLKVVHIEETHGEGGMVLRLIPSPPRPLITTLVPEGGGGAAAAAAASSASVEGSLQTFGYRTDRGGGGGGGAAAAAAASSASVVEGIAFNISIPLQNGDIAFFSEERLVTIMSPDFKIINKFKISDTIGDVRCMIQLEDGRLAFGCGYKSMMAPALIGIFTIERAVAGTHEPDIILKTPSIDHDITFLTQLKDGTLICGTTIDQEVTMVTRPDDRAGIIAWQLNDDGTFDLVTNPSSGILFRHEEDIGTGIALQDGGYIYTVEDRLYDVYEDDTSEIYSSSSHDDVILCLAELPGEFLVSGDINGVLNIWKRQYEYAG